jgi:hypothetical protein
LAPKSREPRKAQPTQIAGHAKIALDFIRELYRIESPLWDREHPVSAHDRVRVRAERSAPVMERFRRWLEALAPQVVPQSRCDFSFILSFLPFIVS